MKKNPLSINDFFVGLSGKSKLIIYLLSREGCTFDHVKTMDIGKLAQMRDEIANNGNPDLIDFVDYILTGRKAEEPAFQYTSGRSYSESRIKDILIRAHAQAGLEYKGLKHFQETVSQK